MKEGRESQSEGAAAALPPRQSLVSEAGGVCECVTLFTGNKEKRKGPEVKRWSPTEVLVST